MVQHLQESCTTTSCLIDSSGNGYHSTPYEDSVITDISTTSGKISIAQSFNGNNRYIYVPTISISGSITAEAWVYSSDFNQNGFIVQKAPVNTRWGFFFESNQIKWRGGNTTNEVAASVPSNNNWHYVVATQTGTNAAIYINGVLATSRTNTTAINDGTGAIDIGRHDGASGYYFNGTIDEVRLSYNARSSSWIKAQYNSMSDNFNTYGNEELYSPKSWQSRTKITVTNSTASQLTDYQVKFDVAYRTLYAIRF
jgi:hypothetical protein